MPLWYTSKFRPSVDFSSDSLSFCAEMSLFTLVNAVIVNTPAQSSQLLESSPPIKPVMIVASELHNQTRITNRWTAANYYCEYVKSCGVATREDIKAAEEYTSSVMACLMLSRNFHEQQVRTGTDIKPAMNGLDRPHGNAQTYEANKHVLTPVSISPDASLPIHEFNYMCFPAGWTVENSSPEHLTQFENHFGLIHDGDKTTRIQRIAAMYDARPHEEPDY